MIGSSPCIFRGQTSHVAPTAPPKLSQLFSCGFWGRSGQGEVGLQVYVKPTCTTPELNIALIKN